MSEPVQVKPSFAEALVFWVRLGFINFGGPAGQIAIMHRELVDRKHWISEPAFLRALNFCTLLPGPEAQQLATYVGWRLHGTLGGVVAGSFFVIPSVFVLMALSWLVAEHADVRWVAGLLYGIQAVVIAIVAEAVVRIGRRALRHPILMAIAAAAFAALFFLRMPFPLVIVTALLAGAALQSRWPHVFLQGSHMGAGADAAAGELYPSLGRTVGIVAVFLVLWAGPLFLLLIWRGPGDVLVQEALFFTQAAFVTFGGAYAVLSYIAEVAVNQFQWLDAEQMVQGLGLAESTPGPLIMVTQYVGFLGAWRFHGSYDPLANGILGGLVTTYNTFLPCFMFIFVGAPYVEALATNRRIQAALVAVTAAIVGVILNLAVVFATQVLFPEGRGFDFFALVVAIASYVAIWRLHLQVYFLVPIGAVVGMAATLLRPLQGIP